MKIYVAAKFEEASRAHEVMAQLRAAGHIITHDWTGEAVGDRTGDVLESYLRRCAEADINGVFEADLLLLLNHPAGKGIFVELGAALVLSKPVIVVDRERAPNNIFFHMTECDHVRTIDEALALINVVRP